MWQQLSKVLFYVEFRGRVLAAGNWWLVKTVALWHTIFIPPNVVQLLIWRLMRKSMICILRRIRKPLRKTIGLKLHYIDLTSSEIRMSKASIASVHLSENTVTAQELGAFGEFRGERNKRDALDSLKGSNRANSSTFTDWLSTLLCLPAGISSVRACLY